MSYHDTHQVEPEGFWSVCLMTGTDGYATASMAAQFGWQAIGTWGRDGWDLGFPPLVMIFHREKEGRFDLAVYVEPPGDIIEGRFEQSQGEVTVYSFPTSEVRERATDEIAFSYWQEKDDPWVQGITSAEEMPEWLRGPYSEERAREHDVPGAVLAYRVHAERPSRMWGRVDSADMYYPGTESARQSFVERRAEYSFVVLLVEWQPIGVQTGRSAPWSLVLATHGEPPQVQQQAAHGLQFE